ncbi:MAG TPA: ABC transporter substrate-binding protein [Candidatus Paceibacterota bacterium]|nr:ABC transporter substrate-binding protein [Candidatus Paceibacterota bacterium]
MDPLSSPSSEHTEIQTAALRVRRISRFATLERLLLSFTTAERLLLYILAAALALSAFVLLVEANAAVSVRVPTSGGTLVEGEIGPVRFINPVLTLSQADEDVSALVYSGLTRALPDGSIVPDLASSYTVSEDGTTYTFTMRPNATFQDGKPVTSADVVFTVQTIQKPEIKSPHRADWEGVVVSAPDAHTVVFKLPHAYAPFLDNTTLGILPQHLWGSVTAEEFPFSPLNTHPVGSGAFQVADSAIDSTGSATRYTLTPFNKFTLGQAYLKKITFLFYDNEDQLVQALNQGKIDAIAGLTPDQLPAITRKNVSIMTSVLPRIFGVFYNQGHQLLLADSSVRSALDAAIDKQKLVTAVLDGYGVSLDSPVPPGINGPAPVKEESASTSTLAYSDETIQTAHGILQKGGWTYNASNNTWQNSKKQVLQFTLATADSPQLVATANALAAAWKTLGINVTVQVYSLTELNTSVIRPRSYDALLFGEVVGRELDLFAFWHSSQRNDPGLNLSLYANSKSDSFLSQSRATTDPSERATLQEQFIAQLKKDDPATFLYAPEFVYIVPHNLKGISLGALTTPSERFANAYQWYTDTENVWSFFAPESATSSLY